MRAVALVGSLGSAVALTVKATATLFFATRAPSAFVWFGLGTTLAYALLVGVAAILALGRSRLPLVTAVGIAGAIFSFAWLVGSFDSGTLSPYEILALIPIALLTTFNWWAIRRLVAGPNARRSDAA